jgi:Na+/glutamate symporter
MAFLVVPMVGAFFIDIVNALCEKLRCAAFAKSGVGIAFGFRHPALN